MRHRTTITYSSMQLLLLCVLICSVLILKIKAEGDMITAEDNKHFCIMRTPPHYSVLRINLNFISREDAIKNVSSLLSHNISLYRIYGHTEFDDVIIIEPRAFDILSIKLHTCELYVDCQCGTSVMRGSHIFLRGILGSSTPDDEVSVFMDLHSQCLRGWLQPLDSNDKVFLGNGKVLISRKDVFSQGLKDTPDGIGVEMMMTPYRLPPLNQLEEALFWCYSTQLPSIACVYALDPKPGDIILDMCSAPGGKATHLSALTKSKARLICLEQSSRRLTQLKAEIKRQKLDNITAFLCDAKKACSLSASIDLAMPPFPPNSFDRILLDAPCSGKGQRPLTKYGLTRGESKRDEGNRPIQKKLLRQAIRLLKVGGTMVYSTCTLDPEENELAILKTLDKYGDAIKLMRNTQKIICPTKLSKNSDDMDIDLIIRLREQRLVTCYDPRLYCQRHIDMSCLNVSSNDKTFYSDRPCNPAIDNIDCDTIGFFFAIIRKVKDITNEQ